MEEVCYSNKLTIIPGDIWGNETLKLRHLMSYYDPEKIFYIPKFDRKCLVSKDEIDAHIIMMELTNQSNLKDTIEYNFNISDTFTYERLEKGAPIDCGYMNLMSMFFGILFHPCKELIVCIDLVEMHMHELLRARIIDFLMSFGKIKKIYITTNSDLIMKKFPYNLLKEEKVNDII